MYQDFFKAVLLKLQSLNSLFLNPLPINEVISTAKSIARWTWTHDKEAYDKFINRQHYKLNRANNKRLEIMNDRKQQAIDLKNAGYCNTKIAEILGIKRLQVYRYFNEK